MRFRKTKLLLALGSMAFGLSLALIWHAWQAWVLHRGYPFNTLLALADYRFSDLTMIVDIAHLPSPYQSQWGGYLPTSYEFAAFMGWFSPAMGTWLFLSIGSLGLWLITIVALRPLIMDPQNFLLSAYCTIAVATGLTWFSYPLLITLDRANIELLMALFIALALLCFYWKRPNLGLICLIPPICLKLYPCLLLLLFLRPGYILKIGGIAVAVVILNLICFWSYAGTMLENWNLWQRNLHFMNDYYIIKDGQLHGSASPWNALKLILEICVQFTSDQPQAGFYSGLRADFLESLYRLYGYLSLAVIFVVVWYSILIETEFFRRVILLLLVMTLCVPSGGDYRLLYADIAMVILILLPTRRRYDLLILGLIVFALVPKKEFIFSFTGMGDVGYRDTSLSTLFNSPALLLAMGLLMLDGGKVYAFRTRWPRLVRLARPIYRG